MLSLVTAAEQQYRHDSWIRDRELAVLSAIRDRRAPAPMAPTVVRVAPRHRRAVWARPIGLHSEECSAACAPA